MRHSPARAMMYTIHLPFVSSGKEPYFGLAMAWPPTSDTELLGIEWRYNWQAIDVFRGGRGQFVPMLWTGEPDKRISAGYNGYLLAFNEPDNPRQLNITPDEAASMMRVVRSCYPDAKIIGPATLTYNQAWLRSFVACGVLPDIWAVHSYIEGIFTIDMVKRMTADCHAITGGDYWITEYGVMDGNTDDFIDLTEWFIEQPWIKRIAPYTNRQPAGQDWTGDLRLNMVRDDGTLNPHGAWYRDRIKRG